MGRVRVRSSLQPLADDTACAAAELPVGSVRAISPQGVVMHTAGIVQSLPSLPIVRHGLAATVRAGAARLWDFVHACHSEDRSVAHFLPDFGAEMVVALFSTRHAIEYVLIRSTSRASADRIYRHSIRFDACRIESESVATCAKPLRSRSGELEGCLLLPQEV